MAEKQVILDQAQIMLVNEGSVCNMACNASG